MTDFITHLNKLKKQKLSQIESDLQVANQAALEQLQKQADQAKTAYERQKSQLHNQLVSQHSFSAQQETNFASQQLQMDLLNQVWQETTSEFFKQDKNISAWLANGLDLIKNQDGVLKTGASLEQIKKQIGSTNKVTLVEDKKLSHTAGFVFETESTVLDYRLDSFLGDLFQAHKHQLFKTLFVQE